MENKNNDIILALIAKREYPYIREHVEYHLNLGFDKIYIGDNNDDNNESYYSLLSDLINDGKVEIFDYRHAPSQQINFYNYIVKNVDYQWCAFIDCDEFLTFNENCNFKNIKEFLLSNENINYYHVNWMCYGDNNQCFKKEGKIVDRFTTPMPIDFKIEYNFSENRHIKSIVKKGTGSHFVNPHYIEGAQPFNPSGDKVSNKPFADIDYNILFIRHFYTKSLEEWCDNKLPRNGGNNKNLKYGIDRYFKYNEIDSKKKTFLFKRGLLNENKSKRCVIVIPVYKNKLSEFEQSSLKQIVNVCGDRYDIVLICPKFLNTKYYNDIANYIFMVEYYDDKYFLSQRSYSNLCLEEKFYQPFSNYEYMLIYQLDAWIFNDRIDDFCNMGYDYYGAPHLWGIGEPRVGNGGFSLRKITAMIKACQTTFPKTYLLEDRIFTEVYKDLSICPLDVAFDFSWQDNPSKAMSIYKKLPMGGHAIERYMNFWYQYLSEIKNNEKIVSVENIENTPIVQTSDRGYARRTNLQAFLE